jgi:hypothetical protein
MSKRTKWIGGEEYLRLASGKMINISELVRMSQAVDAAIPPGASEADEDRIIRETVKRMSPN